MNNNKQLLLVLMFLFFGLTSFAFSQITSTQSGNWSDVATWTGGVVPTSSDNVVISNTVTVDIADAACNDLTVADGGRLYFDVVSGLGITINGSAVVDTNGRVQAASSTPSSGQYFQSIEIKKDLTVANGGRFDMRQSSGSNLAVCRVFFSGNSNSTISLSLTNLNNKKLSINNERI